MADTVTTPIFATVWTEVQQGTSGTFTNNAQAPMWVREAAVNPGVGVDVGHPFRPNEWGTYNLAAGQKIFARSIRDDGLVSVTES